MKEIKLNLHIHSTLSDGHAGYKQIARAAANSDLDVIIITDHNVYPSGLEGYYEFGKKQVLVLTGEEIHDQGRLPQKDHMLVFRHPHDLAQLADRTQTLIDRINSDNGLSFIAHPIDPAMDFIGEPDISWTNWEAYGYTGFEIWNNLSEIKYRAKNMLQTVFYVLFPRYLAHNPIPEVVSRWDGYLNAGKKLVAIGGSDAHELQMHLGPFTRKVYPYEYHFRAINNHVLLPNGLTGDLKTDKSAIFQALGDGNLFIGYDLPYPTDGFRFTAQNQTGSVSMGQEIDSKGGVTFQIHLPNSAKTLLFRNGEVIQRWKGDQTCIHTTSQPGIYRVEAWIPYLGQRRCWIFSNPIYVR